MPVGIAIRRRYRRRRNRLHLTMLHSRRPASHLSALLALIPNLLPLSAHRCSLRKDFFFLMMSLSFYCCYTTDTHTRTFATTCE